MSAHAAEAAIAAVAVVLISLGPLWLSQLFILDVSRWRDIVPELNDRCLLFREAQAHVIGIGRNLTFRLQPYNTAKLPSLRPYHTITFPRLLPYHTVTIPWL